MANVVSNITKNLGGVISKNSSTLLTGLAVAGMITTTVLAVKATPKALMLLQEMEEQKDGDERIDLSPIDMAKATWPCYIPAIAMGAATVLCIIGANSINLRRNAALASLYSITETAFKEYKAKVVETIGKGKETLVRDRICADTIKDNPPRASEIILTGNGDVICYDTMSGRYFKSNIEHIRQVINEFNKNLLSDMFMPLNDLYYALGLSPIKLGDAIGWDIDRGLLEVSFSAQITDTDEPCIVMNYDAVPRYIK